MKAPAGWPQSLTGRLLALLLLALLISHLAGVWLLSSLREEGGLHSLARRKAIELYAHVYQGVKGLDAAAARQVLGAATQGTTVFGLGDVPADLPLALRDGGMADELARLLDLPAAQLIICSDAACQPPPGAAAVAERPLRTVVIQARRPDGLWLTAAMGVEIRTRWWWPVSFWLQVSVVPLLLAVVLAARGLLAPGRALVAAAGRVSRGEQVTPLPVTGPREMREITQAFNHMQHRIQRFVDDRTRMLAAISHDFRTPITSLRLWVELIDDSALREPMLRTLRDMRSMVDATLKFARDDAEHETTVEADLRELLDNVMSAHRLQQHDVVWAEGGPPAARWHYRCRPVNIQRMVGNLVDNAVRHGERARLRLLRSDDGARLLIDIEDDGPGIRPDAREAVFAPFKRLVADRVAPGGAGLGLAIARSCARSHGGDIELRDGPGGRGLLARVWLPL